MSENTSRLTPPSGAERRLEAALVFLQSGRLEEAIDEARRAGDLARDSGDDRSLARAENLIGEIEWGRGRWDHAGRLFGAAREHAEAAGDEALLLLVESNDAAVWTDLGQAELARDSLDAALPRLRILDDHPEGTRILCNLARALAADGQVTAADGLLARAMNQAKRDTDYRQGASLAIERARLALAHGDALRADAHMSAMAPLVERAGDDALRADAACLEGEAYRRQGRPETAERCLLRAIDLARAANAQGVAAQAWRMLAELRAEENRLAEAIEALEAARLQFVALGARARAAEAGHRASELQVRTVSPS